MGSTSNLEMQNQHTIVQIFNSHSHPKKRPPLDLLNGEARKSYLEICVPLYEAALKGDWEAAKVIINKNEAVVRMSITKNMETVLHVAASTKHTDFVENLVEFMETDDLKLQNKNDNTALCLAAAAGTLKIAEIMVGKNEDLPMISGSNRMKPLYMAALFGHSSMVKYLYDMTHQLRDAGWTVEDRIGVFKACVDSEFYDIALDILEHDPNKVQYWSALYVLARKPFAFSEKSRPVIRKFINSIKTLRAGHVKKKTQAIELVRIIWKEVVKHDDSTISDIIRGHYVDIDCVDCVGKDCMREGCNTKGKVRTWPSRLLFAATELGNIKFITELIRIYPDLIWKIDDEERNIFHIAVLHRQESIYNLLYEIGSFKDLITPQRDVNGNNMLHLAAMKPKQNRLDIVSGVALQMQRELLWFKEVENMMHPSYREKKNNEGKTPQELFTEAHKDLVSKGEDWMKNTASQCMVVAALIATIVFGAAFTLLGGNNSDNGNPIILHKRSFMVFVISDSISLFSSSASILIFLSILTSRYAERDFLKSLPRKLMIGLTTLFFSITTMMIAFSSSFFIVYQKGLMWVPILITVFAAMPVILFVRLQYRLLADVIRSTYGSRYLFRPKTCMLY